jgi:hypothetical protein
MGGCSIAAPRRGGPVEAARNDKNESSLQALYAENVCHTCRAQ